MRDGLLTTTCLLCLLTTACQEVPPELPWTAFEEELVLAEPLLLFPGPRWRQHGEDRWHFLNRSNLLCWVREATGKPLVVRLRPNRFTAEYHFRFSWDGEELDPGRIRHDENGWRVEIPPEELTPGRHRLTLDRAYELDAQRHRKSLRNVFTRLVARYADERIELTVDRLPRYAQLANFLLYEVAGREREHRGGLLFVGPARHELTLTRNRRATLRLEPQNLSDAPAVFRLRAADGDETSLALEAGARGVLRATLEPGTRPLVLEVEGDPRGFYLWGAPVVEPRRGDDRVPIVLVTLDTTRRDALGPYNGRAGLTPNLDRLAEEATVFEQAYSTAPWTLPSHASIMTGLWPSKHGAGVSERHLAGGSSTLARLLRRRGYFTAGFSSGDLSSARFGLAQGFHYYRDPDHFETLGGQLDGYLDDFLEEHGDLPLFLFVNYFDPHALYQAPAEFEERLGVAALREKVRGKPVWDELLDGKMRAWRRLVEGEGEVGPEALGYLEAAYLAEVAYTDHLLGRLFERLDELGLWDRALIVITADHGELLGEGGYFSHGARLDPELVEIPLIVKWPGQREGGRSRRLTSLVDLYPTILRAAGLEPPRSDGRLIVAQADGGGSPHRYVLLEEHASLVHQLPVNMKLAPHLFGVQRPDFRQLLWDDTQSCARRNGTGWNEAACSIDPQQLLAIIQAQLGLVEYEDGQDAPISEEMRKSLEALGYL